MAKKPLRVGVIGVGAIAVDRHLPYWQELEGEGRIELAGVCDAIKDRAETVKERFGARKAYTSYKKMLREQHYEIVDICAHNRFHCPIALEAVRAGAHVLVEKPMAMNARQAQDMVRAARTAKRKLMVAHHMRFESAHEKLKEVAERGDLGRIYTASAVYLRRRGIPGWGKFHIKRESSGGPLIDIGVHVLDLALWFMGFPKPRAVSGKVYRMFGGRPDLVNAAWGEPYPRKEFDVEDYATAWIRLDGDLTLHLEVSWAANIPEDRSGILILGDRAGVSTNPLGLYSFENEALTSIRFDWLPRQEGHRTEIRHFTECVEKNLPVWVQPEESLVVQRILDAIYESSRKNREVRIL